MYLLRSALLFTALLALLSPLATGQAQTTEGETSVYFPLVTTLQPYIASDGVIIYRNSSNPFFDNAVILGEIVNPLSVAICTQISTETYTADGGLVEQYGTSSYRIDPLYPGEVTPFEVRINRIAEVASYALRLNYTKCSSPPYLAFNPVRQEVGFAGDRGSFIRGTLRNESSVPLQSVTIVGTFYDRGGRVIRVNYGEITGRTGVFGPYQPGESIDYLVTGTFDLRGVLGGARVLAHAEQAPTTAFEHLSAGPVHTTTTGLRPWQPIVVANQ
jgi:hypothetical protein